MRRAYALLQKKQTQSGYLAAAGKTGNEEKWAHASMEYVYEKVHVNDSKKRKHDIVNENQMAFAYDRFDNVSEAHFEMRMGRLISRLTDALDAIPSDELRDEAIFVNSQQPPLNFRRPSLTPPIFGYEPGFGFDVPQLKAQPMEYPSVIRPTDRLEQDMASSPESSFPFVESDDLAKLADFATAQLEREHGEIRSAAPLTGVEGEAWEAYTALNKKALARQRLILDLSSDPQMRERYESDDDFRVETLQSRGIMALEVEVVDPHQLKVERHYSQDPHYQPIREY
jgi:hypothetical protein